ncbi:YlxR family protein [Fructilactobacillus fructivorans]|uniref:RNase P modulator RnpM n=1 Tax=Fructilactobacillus fructivorans TaxID=1614 RepID=UPI00070CA01B|nr:YlxR family protein [Fructilactobacillus fructivorans]
MRKRKVPMRKDVVSGEMATKRQLVRIVRDKEGNVSVDPTGKQSGRGAYIKIDVETAKRAKQDKILDQVFEVTLTDDFYDKLIDYVDHKQARQELIDNDKL